MGSGSMYPTSYGRCCMLSRSSEFCIPNFSPVTSMNSLLSTQGAGRTTGPPLWGETGPTVSVIQINEEPAKPGARRHGSGSPGKLLACWFRPRAWIDRVISFSSSHRRTGNHWGAGGKKTQNGAKGGGTFVAHPRYISRQGSIATFQHLTLRPSLPFLRPTAR